MTRLPPSAYRYRFDDPHLYGIDDDDLTQPLARSLPWALSQHVRISGSVLPRLQAVLDAAAEAVGFESQFTGFVYASPEMNARCSSEPDGRALILVSSALVELLSTEEMRFVVGHEFAHAHFGHYGYPAPTPGSEEPHHLELMRSAEITADRVGLACCASVDDALRAIMKTASGLSDQHLEIDLVDYLRQGAMLRAEPDDTLAWSTHPPLVLRARSVLRFEALLHSAAAGDDISDRLSELDNDVFDELEIATHGIDGPQVARDAAFWAIASRVCADGDLDVCERERLAAMFGADRVRDFVDVIAAQTRGDVLSLIDARVAETTRDLAEAPLGAQRRFEDLMRKFSDGGPTRAS